MTASITLPDSPEVGFDLVSFELREAMSELFSLAVTVQSTNANIEMRALVGQGVVLHLGETSVLPRVAGIVREVRVASTETTGVSRYHLSVVPPLWLTTRRVNHRIFQDRTVPQIIEDVLQDYGGRIPAPVQRFGSSYAAKTYCAQYGETDHDFIFRLLSDEGITTFFDHAGGSRWVLVDQTDSLTPVLPATVPYIEPSFEHTPAAAPTVSHVVICAKIETSALRLRDYDFQKPSFTLEARSTAEGAELFVNEPELETYAYDAGDVRTEDQAARRARRLLQATRAPARRFELTANFPVGAGTRFSLAGHPRTDVNTRLLVIRSTTQGQLLSSSHHFECIDASAPYRPRRVPPPRIIGTQTAFVVPAAAGDEIDVDELGQVRVEFRWDRRGLGVNTSRMVRVSQSWAGPGYGLMCLPRAGDEVIVEFLDGDPDQPIIIGRVHNAVNVPPLKLPEQKTISVWRSRSSPGGAGYNQILLDDLAGSERIELHAERDFLAETGRNSTTTVGSDQRIRVDGHSSTTVAGAYSVQAQSSTLSTGDFKLTARNIKQEAMNDVEIDAANRLLEMSLNHFVETNGFWVHPAVIMQIVTPTLDVMCDKISLCCGGSSIEITSGGIKIKSAGTIEIHGGDVDVKGQPIKLNS
jgi:type VI secretion system secreted protein VgrG